MNSAENNKPKPGQFQCDHCKGMFNLPSKVVRVDAEGATKWKNLCGNCYEKHRDRQYTAH